MEIKTNFRGTLPRRSLGRRALRVAAWVLTGVSLVFVALDMGWIGWPLYVASMCVLFFSW